MTGVATRMVALLRGINVGGNKRVDMGRLRDLLTSLGHTEVRTYLQSGNAVFSCARDSIVGVGGELEAAIVAAFGFESRVIVRTEAELAHAISADPLLDLIENPSRHLVGFLSGRPRADATKQLAGENFGVDRLRIVGQHAYLWCPNGLTGSPFGKLNFDRILGVAVTMRNWNTVTKLAELASS